MAGSWLIVRKVCNMVKELSEMTLEELWQLFPVIQTIHNEEYSNWYKAEEKSLLSLINTNDVFRISHIGSSAVKNLVSKPTIDILLEIKNEQNFNSIAEILSKSGWTLMCSKTTPYLCKIFNKGYTKYGFAEKVYHLHFRLSGDWGELYFRDYLIENPEIAEEYGKLKLKLLEKYKNDRDAFTEAKSEFVLSHTKIAKENYGDKYNPDFY